MGESNDDGGDEMSADSREPSRPNAHPTTAMVLTPRHGTGADDNCAARLTVVGPSSENALVVSYTQTVDEVVDDWQAHVGPRPAEFGVISFGEFTRSSAQQSRPTPQTLPGHDITVTTMADESDLQGLGTAITLYLDEWDDNENQTVVCFNSLGPMLRERDVEEVFQFLHLLTECIKRAGAFAHFHLNPRRHDDQTINTLKPLFDTVVETTDGPSGYGNAEAETREWLLRNPRRRHALSVLFQQTETLGLRSLAVSVAARENQTSVDELTSLECDRVYTALATSHLPQLQNADVVEFDADRKEVRLTDDARENEALRQLVEQFSDGSP